MTSIPPMAFVVLLGLITSAYSDGRFRWGESVLSSWWAFVCLQVAEGRGGRGRHSANSTVDATKP